MAILAYIYSISQGFIGKIYYAKKQDRKWGLADEKNSRDKISLKSLTNTRNYDKRL
jgi:hypothetical protein